MTPAQLNLLLSGDLLVAAIRACYRSSQVPSGFDRRKALGQDTGHGCGQTPKKSAAEAVAIAAERAEGG